MTLVAQNRSGEQELLQSIKADTRALVQAPYHEGIGLLEEARAQENAQRRRAYVEKAIDAFRRARSISEARDHIQDLFPKALAEYQIGNCNTLLSSNEDARTWFQRAHATAVHYFHLSGQEVGDWAKIKNKRGKRALQGFLGGCGTSQLGWVFPPAAVVGAGAAAISGVGGGIAWMKADYSYDRAKKKFMEEAPRVLDFVLALKHLHSQAPRLRLELDESPPLPSSADEWTLTGWLGKNEYLPGPPQA